VIENNKIGYINRQGQIVLPPIYRGGEQFSEGLAPVRLKGRYGYITEKGNFVIDAQFDLARPFSAGLALVYKDGHPYFIDHKGQSPFDCSYTAIQSFRYSLALIKTHSGKWGAIDHSGELILDTVYDIIRDFNEGLATVMIRTKVGYKTGLVDTLGNVIVAPGGYKYIGDFNEGYAHVKTKQDNNNFIDRTGKLVFRKPFQQNIDIDNTPFGDGIAIITINDHYGFIDLRGRVLLNDPTVTQVRPFSNRRAFIKRNDGYRMIDTRMQPVGTTLFEEVQDGGFINGYAIVQTEKGWGVVDTNARFIIQPNSSVEDFDHSGFTNGLLMATIGGKLAFINTRDEIVWKARDTTPSLTDLNIDYMLRGQFCAYSSPDTIGQEQQGGGWSISRNIPRRQTPRQFEDNKLNLTIDTQKIDTFSRSFNGFPIYLSNTTADTCAFHAQDSRLYMKIQAQDKHGDWKDINYLPSSWCGNSYHIINLEPGAYWKFMMPRFEGDISTILRLRLEYIDKGNPKENKILYSNSIKGNINPAQFWNKQRYYPQGLMDPYFD
jgi:hypothetical protein